MYLSYSPIVSVSVTKRIGIGICIVWQSSSDVSYLVRSAVLLSWLIHIHNCDRSYLRGLDLVWVYDLLWSEWILWDVRILIASVCLIVSISIVSLPFWIIDFIIVRMAWLCTNFDWLSAVRAYCRCLQPRDYAFFVKQMSTRQLNKLITFLKICDTNRTTWATFMLFVSFIIFYNR